MNYTKRSFSMFAAEPSVRFDNNFIKSIPEVAEETYSYKSLFEIVQPTIPKLDEAAPFLYAEIGHVSQAGDVSPVSLSFEDRNELNEDLFKKIEKGYIFLPAKGNILISTIRPNLNKMILIREDEKQEIFFTKAFIQIKPLINSRLLYYSLKWLFFDRISALSRQGKGFPAIKEDDLKTLEFPKYAIDTLLAKQSEILESLKEIEKEINDLKRQQVSKKQITDEVFANHFQIEIDKLLEFDRVSSFNIKLSSIAVQNGHLRHSYRWHKMQLMQKTLYQGLSCIDLLGKYIVDLKIGWSPESIVGGEGTPVLGQEHFDFDAQLKLTPTKATTKTRNNIEQFYINEGDLFVSRGNTLNLVALASVVETEVTEDIIYPDLYIRLQLDETVLNKKYLALLFNSFIGRLYFKYVSKGKNQTMVKISSDELMNYYIPIPPLKEQEAIVKEIEERIKLQKEIEKKIETKQNQIGSLLKGYL